MSCPHWKDDWIAHLYGELEPGEERSLAEHLEECPACRGEMARLGETRLLLHASPEADAAPTRVMVLSPARRLRPALAFAAGLAAAAALFLAGSYAGSAGREPGHSVADDGAALLDAIGEQGRRLERLEQVAREPRPAASDAALPAREDLLTKEDLRRSLDQLESRWDQERARELEFVLRSISAAQARVDETQEALQVLAVRDDPRFRER